MRFLPNGIGNLCDLVAHFAKIHSVNDFSGDVVTLRAVDDLLERGRSFHRCAHGEKVVFTNENDRQLVQCSQVQRFVKRTLINRPISEEAERDAIFVTVLDREGQPYRQRHMSADDCVPAVHVVFLVEKMHGSAKSTRAAGLLAEKLCHARLCGCATGKSMPVITVCGDDVIIRANSSHRASHNRFLSNVKVTKSTNLLRLILLAGAFFEAPDQQHQREHLDFVALLQRLHGGQAVRGTGARARDPAALRPSLMQTTKSRVNNRSLTSELRKNIQLGVALY